MATIRRAGFGTVFELEDSKVGIGTDAATHTLQALGNIRSEAATDIGISSLTTYQGFVDEEARFTTGQIDNQSQSGSTSGEIVIDGDVTVSSAPTFTSGPQNLTVTDTFTLPLGDTNSRELKPTAGSLRFNQDFSTLEFYTGNNWATVNTFTDIKTNPQGRGRAVLSSGGRGNNSQVIDFINISTLGNAINFGENTQARTNAFGCSSEIRGVFGGGYSGGNVSTMDYITIPSEGNAISFGSLSSARNATGSCGSSTRGLWGGGQPYVNIIDYVEIATLGTALDFGDLGTKAAFPTAVSSTTRGIWVGGANPSTPTIGHKVIQFIIISSKGNAVNFGSLTQGRRVSAGSANNVRGVFGGGDDGAGGDRNQVSIEYITLASEGNAVNFGNLSAKRFNATGAASQTRATFCGGMTPTVLSLIEFVQIASTGNAQDFGDLTQTTRAAGGVSDSHGGLGGF